MAYNFYYMKQIIWYNKYILHYLKGSDKMDTAKQILLKLIDEIPENQIHEIIDFIGYLKIKNERDMFKELEEASKSSMDFWDNDIDDDVWNNV